MSNLSDGITRVPRHHYDGVSWHLESSQVVSENPVTLLVNGNDYVTAALTPIDLKDWALGLLAGDGIIDRADQVTIFQWRAEDGQIWLRVPGYRPDRQRPRYLGSCCGQSRPGFFNPTGIDPIISDLQLRIDDLQSAFDALSQWSQTQHSGGLHAAALVQGADLVIARADVGRHNALDKVFGAALQRGDVVSTAYLVFSGRLSAEIVWKVRTMGVPAVVSNAAPTSLGIDLADKLGITAIGFLRGQELSVFSHPERLALPRLSVSDL